MAISKEDLRPPPIDIVEQLSFSGEGVINLLVECEKYIFSVEDSVSIERKVRFLLYDIDHLFSESPPSAKELLTHLINQRGLSPVDDAAVDVQGFRVSNLCHRSPISHSLLSLVFGYLLAKYKTPFVHFLCNGQTLIRTQDKNSNVFIAWDQPLTFLDSAKLLKRMSQEAPDKANLEPHSPFALMTRYLRKLKLRLQLQGYGPEYLRTLNLLIAAGVEKYSSTELVERGLFLEKVSFNKEALKDLKRYFHFCRTPEDNTTIYQTYQKLLSITESENLKG